MMKTVSMIRIVIDVDAALLAHRVTSPWWVGATPLVRRIRRARKYNRCGGSQIGQGCAFNMIVLAAVVKFQFL